VLKARVANVCFKCFRCFRDMLQVFYMDVAYAASVSEACCKHLFKVFHLFSDVCCKRLDLDIAYVSHICYKSMF
jgi:hypothetical protein